MLYRPQTTAARLATALRAGQARLRAALAHLRKTGADTAYIQSASDHMLFDLGVRRIEARADPWKHIY
jgi:uncharacterized protein YjiS (DUF1127 family)